jgi:hypothetical protein
MDLFSIVCYGYQKGIVSSYQLAEAVANRLDFIYLAGGHQVKRRTLSEFRRRHRNAISDLLLQSINIAIKAKLVKPESIFALDGSKIFASANYDRRKNREDLQEEQGKLMKSVEDFLNEWEKNDEAEENIEEERAQRMREVRERLNNLPTPKPTLPTRLPTEEELKKIHNRKKEPTKPDTNEPGLFNVKSEKDAEKAIERASKIAIALEKNPSATINMTDPDSRLMKFGNNIKEGYNAQVISSNHFIVAADVCLSENDQDQLEPMLNSLLEIIKPDENDTIQFLADAGYNRGANLAWLETKPEIDPYISMYRRKDENEFSKEAFKYDEARDEYTCPEGKILEHSREVTRGDGKTSIYGATLQKCVFCKNREKCLSGDDVSRGYRTISDDAFAPLRHAMRDKMKVEESKLLYRKRSGAIESIFGYLKMKGLRHFRMRGLEGVRAEFLLAALALNLKRISRAQKKESMIQAA